MLKDSKGSYPLTPSTTCISNVGVEPSQPTTAHRVTPEGSRASQSQRSTIRLVLRVNCERIRKTGNTRDIILKQHSENAEDQAQVQKRAMDLRCSRHARSHTAVSGRNMLVEDLSYCFLTRCCACIDGDVVEQSQS